MMDYHLSVKNAITHAKYAMVQLLNPVQSVIKQIFIDKKFHQKKSLKFLIKLILLEPAPVEMATLKT